MGSHLTHNGLYTGDYIVSETCQVVVYLEKPTNIYEKNKSYNRVYNVSKIVVHIRYVKLEGQPIQTLWEHVNQKVDTG